LFGALAAFSITLAIVGICRAEAEVVIVPSQLEGPGLELLGRAMVLRDADGGRLADAVLNDFRDGGGSRMSGKSLRAGFSSDVFWLYLQLALTEEPSIPAYLATRPPFIDRVDLYRIDTDGLGEPSRGGDRFGPEPDYCALTPPARLLRSPIRV